MTKRSENHTDTTPETTTGNSTEDATKASPSLLRRLTAMLYDSLLVIAIIAVVNALALGLAVKLFAVHDNLLGPHWVQALTLASVCGFYCLFWLKEGQTLGMQAWRIQLVSIDEQPITVRRALLRCLGALLSALPLGLGYWWCLVDRNKRYWHDYFSGTELRLLPKRNKK